MTASSSLLSQQQRAYRFRAMSAHDLPLVRRWLAMPHVREWWGDADEQFALVSSDLAEPAMDQYVVTCDEHSFAYLHGTRGIDQFIGELDMIDRGHGSAFIRAFVDGLLAAGTSRVLTDPDPANARAIRAYEKAGFRKDRESDTPDGRALLMLRDNPSAG